LWSGRFEGNPDAALVAFGRSFGFDRRLFEDDVRGSLAWAAALARAGVLSTADAAAIETGLQEVLSRGRDQAFFDSPEAQEDEDVHAFVERELVARVGDAGRRLHTGRSRNEQVAVDLRLYLKRRIPEIQRSIVGVVKVLATSAERASDALMPSYTHLRRAQPILAAHFFLAHAAALVRDGRIEASFRKALLPTYDVFDEDRYFEPFHGPQLVDIANTPSSGRIATRYCVLRMATLPMATRSRSSIAAINNW
jgi:argininosuccinate lyase